MDIKFEFNSTTIIFSKSIIDILVSYKQIKNNSNESGGTLVGWYSNSEDNNYCIVSDLTRPQSSDKAKRNYFYRSNKIHQRILDKKWENSGNILSYLGEWHTHPENYPTPSNIDIDNWKQLLKKSKFNGNKLYFAIVGIKQIVFYIGLKDGSKISKLGEYNYVIN